MDTVVNERCANRAKVSKEPVNCSASTEQCAFGGQCYSPTGRCIVVRRGKELRSQMLELQRPGVQYQVT